MSCPTAPCGFDTNLVNCLLLLRQIKFNMFLLASLYWLLSILCFFFSFSIFIFDWYRDLETECPEILPSTFDQCTARASVCVVGKINDLRFKTIWCLHTMDGGAHGNSPRISNQILKLDQVNSANLSLMFWSLYKDIDILVLGQYRAVMADIWWYWVSMGRYWLVPGDSGSV